MPKPCKGAPPSPDTETRPAQSAADSSAAANQVARYRAALDWMLTVPQWEGGVALAISQLGLKGKRQGIAFRSAALSLSLEAKSNAIRQALRTGLDAPTRAEATRLARLWGDTAFRADAGASRLARGRWRELSDRLHVIISSRHLEYKRAQEYLYNRYATLATQQARLHCKVLSRRDDAEQEARLALLQAIDKIDPTQSFPPYARHWIKRRVRNFAMQEQMPVRTPINVVSRSFQIARDDTVPSDPSLALLVACIQQGTVSMDELESSWQANPNDETREATPSPDRQALREDDLRALRQALETLTEKQREVITMRFGLGPTSRDIGSLADVAGRTGISRQQVSKREHRALQRLRDYLSCTPLGFSA